MKKKKSGFTIVEAIIALAVLAIATSAIYLLLTSGTSSLTRTEIKSELQQDAHMIEERMTTLGMQSAGVNDVETKEITLDDGATTNKIESITFKSVETIEGINKVHYLYKFYINDININELWLTKVKVSINTNDASAVEVKDIEYDYALAKNVENIIISDLNGSTEITNIEQAKSINVDINLIKEKGKNSVKLNAYTVITFRNK